MWNYEIEKLLGQFPGFLGVISKDRLGEYTKQLWSNRRCAIIMNLENESEGGSHWVCILGGTGESPTYIDPFGFIYPADSTNASNFKGMQYSDVQFQPIKSKLCGEYCMYFVSRYLEGKSVYDVIYKGLCPCPCIENDKIVKKNRQYLR